MTFSREDPRQRIETRVSDNLFEAVEDYKEQTGLAKAEILRRSLEYYLPEIDIGRTPEDPDLRDVYLWLLENSGEGNSIPADVAISELSQRLSKRESIVKRVHLTQLRRGDWIDVSMGVIHVREYPEGDGSE